MIRGDPVVLVVEDDREVADRYGAWLEERWSVVVAYGGGEALDVLDDEPAVALIDRQLSDVHGDRLVGHVKEQDLASRVAMLTGVEPGIDVAKLGFDDYLVKPVSKESLVSVVERLLLLATYDDLFEEYYSLAAERARLLADRDHEDVSDDDRYRELSTRLSAVRSSLDDVLDDLSERDALDALCEDIRSDGGQLDDAFPQL